VNEVVLIQKVFGEETHLILKDILIALSYSHQNISEMQEDRLFRHEYFTLLAETLIGGGDSFEFLDYRYNRINIKVLRMEQEGVDAKIIEEFRTCQYEKIIEAAKIIETKNSIELISKSNNMMGLILSKKKDVTSEDLLKGKAHFVLALELRDQLIKMSEGDPIECRRHEYFRSNILTGLIHTLVNLAPIDKQELNKHMQSLVKYIESSKQEGRLHAYNSSYTDALAKAQLALGLVDEAAI
jgi:hypothetical protein